MRAPGWLAIAGVIGLAAQTVPAPVTQARLYPVTLVKVIDGDTYRVLVDLGWDLVHKTDVRLTNVSCAEKHTPEGKLALAGAELAFPAGSAATLATTFEREKYGRSLGRLILPGGDDLGDLLLAKGLCRPGDGRKG